ncbi:MAG TPA: NfeD family protein [Bacteroidales bacterium]|nr:NfeD family protein [Bacteroidales bacterium]HRZ49036.1 NfeD family protein [Bacteroidales bacterium]
MMKIQTAVTSFLTMILLLSGFVVKTQTNNSKMVYLLEIRQEIAPPVWLMTKKAFEEAEDSGADLLLIHMNTYGGMVQYADSISTRIMNSKVPTAVFIDNNAASAGAWISIACDSIYMRKGARIGAATVVNQDAEALPDKYQSYMRSSMRATAEAQGRDPNIAEAMVDPDVFIEGIIDSGKVLTFTTAEAIRFGYCEGMAETTDEAIRQYGFTDYRVKTLKLTVIDKIIGFLVLPVVSGILIMLIIGGIYFELQTPGIGFPLAAAVVGALLYFAPLYLQGLAEHWEILLFIIGVILLMVEIFAIPGFGVTGVLGITLIITGLILSMIGNVQFDFSGVKAGSVLISFSVVITAIFLALMLSYLLTIKIFGQSTFLFGQLSLATEQKAEKGYTIMDPGLQGMIGIEGIAHTMLRPAGKILIDDIQYDATAESGYIEKGEKVVVSGYENAQLIVRKG